VGLTNNLSIPGDAIANQKNIIVKQKNTTTRRKNFGTAISEEVLAGGNISDYAGVSPTGTVVNRKNTAAAQKNMNFRRKNPGTVVSEETLAGANISDDAGANPTGIVVNRKNTATAPKNPNATAENEEVDGPVTQKKKSKQTKKLIPQNQQNENQQSENPFAQQRLNNLLTLLFDVDFTKTWEEIEEILTQKAFYAQLWAEKGELLKNNNLNLLSESERFYKIACEKELQVQNLIEQLNIAKNLSGEHS
jgi:hypothetical protein